MKKIVKWIIITSICTIFALDCIVLLSVQASSAAESQKPIENLISNVTTDDWTRLGTQFTDQATGCPKSWSLSTGDGETTVIRNINQNSQTQKPVHLI
jgi:hypothetical protein